MTVQVELSDLETVAAAIDSAITAVEADPVALVGVLELVQTYIDNAQEGDNGEPTEVSDSAADGNDASAESEAAVADEDIPF